MDRQENTAQQQTARRQPPLLQVARQARGSLENVYLKKKKKAEKCCVCTEDTAASICETWCFFNVRES